MIKVEVDLCKDGSGFCSPCLLVTEDTSEDSCPIILPEDMDEKTAIKITKQLKENIESKCQTVAEVKKLIYG